MKTRFLNTHRLARPLPPALALGAVLLLGALTTTQAQTGSPVGSTWDCVLSGKRSGIAYLTFSTTNNGTLNGYEILVPQPLVSPHAILLSDPLVTGPLGVRPPSTNDTTNIYGAFPVNGSWGLDSKGRIVGYFIEVVTSDDCVTNVVSTRTNTFVSIAPISDTNAFQGGFCVTLPLSTNMIPDTYVEQITCYATSVVMSTNSFESLERIEATNTFADGHFCITVPTGTNAGNYVETVTCYAPLAPVSTNTFASRILITDVTYSDGMTCVTLPIATNMVPGSYLEQKICYTNQIDCPGALTNTVNFTGKAVPGKRLTLTCKTPLGTVTMRGVPTTPLTHLSGAWSAVRKQNKTTSYEFFNLTNLVAEPNTYRVSGSGADYTYFGVAGLSSQKKIAFALSVFNLDGSYQSTRAVVGSFNARKLSANTSGLDAPGGTTGLTNRVTFQVTKRPALP